MRDVISKLVGLSCFVAGVSLMAASCGTNNDNNGTNNGGQCGADQTFATVNGVEKCYDNCVDGACDAGFACQSDLCIATEANNGTNNGTTGTNNATTGTNNATTGTNNSTTGTNNATTGTNNGSCAPLNPSIGPCDPLCQTGCAVGEACIAGSASMGAPITAICQPAGTAVAGDTCGQMTACAEGFGCFTTDGTTFACQEFCRVGGGEPACAGQAVCSPFDANEQRIGICAVPDDECTQFPNDSCPDGQNCYLTNLGLRCIAHSPTAMPGDACASPTDCGDGQGCIGDGTNNNCATLCDPNNPMCGQGEQCAQLQGLTYGACVAMMM